MGFLLKSLEACQRLSTPRWCSVLAKLPCPFSIANPMVCRGGVALSDICVGRVKIPISPPLFEEPRRSRSAGLFRFSFLLLTSTTQPIPKIFPFGSFHSVLWVAGGESSEGGRQR